MMRIHVVFFIEMVIFERRVHISMMGIDMNQCTKMGKSWESCGKNLNQAQRVVIYRKMDIHSKSIPFQ